MNMDYTIACVPFCDNLISFSISSPRMNFKPKLFTAWLYDYLLTVRYKQLVSKVISHAKLEVVNHMTFSFQIAALKLVPELLA